jgi:hypothetical protein
MKSNPNPYSIGAVEKFIQTYPKSTIVKQCEEAYNVYKKTETWRRDVARALNSDTSFDNYEF